MDCEDEFAPQGRFVQPFRVVVHPPLFDYHLSLLKRVKDLSIQLLVPQLSVKALTVAVLPRTSWL